MKPLLPIGASYLVGQNVTGIDLSDALIVRAKEHASQVRLFKADAEMLPFKTASFDLIWGRHMLYHTQNVSHTISEACRCLKKSGVFCVSTNSETNKVLMHQFHKEVISLLKLSIESPERSSLRFSAENGDKLLNDSFDFTKTIPYSGYFKFENKKEFLDYYFSTSYFKWLIKQSCVEVDKLKGISSDHFELRPVDVLENDGAIIIATNDAAVFQTLNKYF